MRISNEVVASVNNILSVGAKNALRSKEICSRLGIDSRALRLAVQILRNDGVLICADDYGYYLASNPDEVRRTLERSDRMAKSILKRNKAFRQALDKVPGQTSIS